MRSRARALLFVVGGLLAAGGCHAVLGLDDYQIREPAVGGSGGAAAPCSQPTDCPGTDSTCRQRTCTSSACGYDDAPEGTTCSEQGGRACDGHGQCVECLAPEDCPAAELCQSHQCVPGQCTNGARDGSETGVDCGGADCSPCANGEACLSYADCASAFCDDGSSHGGAGGGAAGSAGSGGLGSGGSSAAGGASAAGGNAGIGGATPAGPGTCAPCANQGDCTSGPDQWCDASEADGTCVARKPLGSSCQHGYECLSEACPADDHVCCDAPCDGECEACLAAKTGGATGSCGPVAAGQDPEAECTAGAPCGPSGAGCNGEPGAPACLGVCSSCEEQFGASPRFHEVCSELPDSCTIRADSSLVGCGWVCAQSGGTCVTAWHDAPEGSCVQGTPGACGLAQVSALCVCSRGCGDGAACTPPASCVAGLCQ